MKNIFLLIPVFLLVIFLILFRVSPCDQPIKYRIDTVDPKFNLDREQFVKDVNAASEIWSKAYGKNLFVYDSKGDLSVNLVFDDRSQLKEEITQRENQVKTEGDVLKPKISDYENQVNAFKQKASDYNTKVNYWNSKGGAPADIYKELNQEQQSLKEESDRLNALAASLNRTADNFNAQINVLNETVDTFNANLSVRPEEGIFDPKSNKINVYFNVDRFELVHTLAHEFGHALGVEHVTNKDAIMYTFANQTITPFPEDISGLQKVCQPKPLWEMNIN